MGNTNTCTGVFTLDRLEWQSMASVSILAEVAGRFKSRIVIQYGGLTVNAKSLISLMMLDVACKASVTVIAAGCDAHTAISTMASVFSM